MVTIKVQERTVSFRVSNNLYETITHAASKNGIAKSEFIRRSLSKIAKEYLRKCGDGKHC